MWDSRFAWSGEIPLNFEGLNPVAMQRITPGTGSSYLDSVNPSRNWTRVGGSVNDGYAPDRFGLIMGLNLVNPTTDQGGFHLSNFTGLWPSSGKMLMGLWARQNYVMAHSPLMSTRSSSSPLSYLATAASGRIRHIVYNAAGTSILDRYEDHPWVQTRGLQFIGHLLDMDNQTSQMFSVEASSKRSWLGPVRTLAGAPNPASTADLEIFSLPGYWTTGAFDEAVVAHPNASFDLAEFVDAMALGLWSDAQSSSNASSFSVDENGVTASSAGSFQTGAERVTWDQDPIVQGAPAGAVPFWSVDNGATWQTGATLPTQLTGLLRWEIPLEAGSTFTGITITIPTTPPPTLGAIPDQVIEQGDVLQVPITYTVDGVPTWAVSSPDVVNVLVNGNSLSLVAGFKVGAGPVEVTLTDSLGRSTSRTFHVTVNARQWDAGAPPKYPHSPVIVWGDDYPEAAIIDAHRAVVAKEVNGAHTFHLTLSHGHRHADLLVNERRVEVAGETFTVRRVTKVRRGNIWALEVYAEAGFYDLATASQVDKQDFTQVTAGDVMSLALEGTGWTVGVANAQTLRTYSIEDTNPLELLREVQRHHGGDLVFDNNNRRVSLVTQSGRDNGVAFFYGSGITDSERVVDTTSLVTRIVARNADGLTIASLNNGLPYVEDYSYTSSLKVATYDFKSGTSPYTMLSMAKATLANRSRPEYSYKVTVSDLSSKTGADLDRYDAGDLVTVVDKEIGITGVQRIVGLEYDVIRPWASQITLSAKMRELGSSDSDDAGLLLTGSNVTSFDLVPFNLLLNSRFDNQLAHWGHLGAEVVDGGGTGDYAVRFSGAGERWVEQTVQPDNRDAYAFSMDVDSRGPAGWSPNISVEAEVTYEDGTTEVITLELS